VRTAIVETTSLGAAFLAGQGVGYWKDMAEVAACWTVGKEFHPRRTVKEVDVLRGRWKQALG
jgi:glycerol kinase